MEIAKKQTERKKFTQITGMRGIVAALTAYLLHYNLLFGTGPDMGAVISPVLGTIAKYWFYASYPFFWLSGFLMFYVYERRLAAGELTFKRYMLPKIKKLYPIMIVTALLVFGLEWAGKLAFGYFPLHADGGELRYSPLSLLMSLLGLQSGFMSDGDAMVVNGPSWFISILLVCYVIYYFVAAHVKKERARTAIYAGMLLLGVAILLHPLNVPFLYFCNGRGYFGFFFGVLTAKYTLKYTLTNPEGSLARSAFDVVCPDGYTLTDSKSPLARSAFDVVCPDGYALQDLKSPLARSASNMGGPAGDTMSDAKRPFPQSVLNRGCLVAILVFVAGVLALYFRLPVNLEVWVDGVLWVPVLYLLINGRVLCRFCAQKPVVWLGTIAMPIFLCDIPTKLLIRMTDLGFGLNLDYSRPWIWAGHIVLSLFVAWIFHLVFEKGKAVK